MWRFIISSLLAKKKAQFTPIFAHRGNGGSGDWARPEWTSSWWSPDVEILFDADETFPTCWGMIRNCWRMTISSFFSTVGQSGSRWRHITGSGRPGTIDIPRNPAGTLRPTPYYTYRPENEHSGPFQRFLSCLKTFTPVKSRKLTYCLIFAFDIKLSQVGWGLIICLWPGPPSFN